MIKDLMKIYPQILDAKMLKFIINCLMKDIDYVRLER